MTHQVEAVFPMADSILGCKFKNGAILLYDLKSVAKTRSFFSLLVEQPELFCKMAVAPGGYGVIGNEDFDLSCDELWQNGWPEWNEDKLVTVEIEVEVKLIRKLEEILHPYGLAPEDWIVMALEYLVCPATKDLAAKWLCQEKQAILRRK